MLNKTIRPHFFPGQLVDYRDFNRLAGLTKESTSLLNAQILRGGGILLQSSEEFQIELGRELTVIVKPGMALLPNGELLTLNEERALNLTAYRPTNGQQRLIVGLEHETVAVDPYVDPEDPSIQGFRSQTEQVQLVVASEHLPVGALELFRVTLEAGTRSLRFPTTSEEWSVEELPATETESVVDTRFRRRLLPLTFAPIDFPELLQLRRAFYAMENAVRRLKRLFLIEDRHGTDFFLAQLHAESLAVPLQPLKAAFLTAEFADRLALFLEAIARKVSVGQSNFQSEIYLEIAGLLDQSRVRHALPRELPFERLLTLASKLEAFTCFAEERFTLMNVVEEALLDLQDRHDAFPEKTTFAGHVFQRVDRVLAGEADRVEFKASFKQMRKLQANYLSGERVTRTGVFVRDGDITLNIKVPNTESAAIVVFPQYARRKTAAMEYLVNGKKIRNEASVEMPVENLWRNRALILPPETLVSQGNQVTLHLGKTELDYGFFEAAVYQATANGGES